ncbi:hypothetical protein KC340_g3017 [Hortaea werneckii]|nr:hypothetical protein KC342_g3602 [Hortaea werneckii]KAI7103514.1 hypothetical protein KC339_g5209 [Hortaea werneckii]KAI7244206.1 hypothetical protein KC365_g1620 [Hortaea werneckii]KAI7333224.1 hypothetical protein KC340_g3017 [Hortaea werneckii]KAI7400224.1 hypothetical protein KC328_g3652 [Hortaea werneckii]
MADAASNAWIVVEVGLRREKGLVRDVDAQNALAQVLRDVVWPTLSDEFKAKIQEHQETYSKANGTRGAVLERCVRLKKDLDKEAGGTADYDFSVEDEGDRYDKEGNVKVTLSGYVEQWRSLIKARRAYRVAMADLRDLLERYVEDLDPPDERIVGNMGWSARQLNDMYNEETKLQDADKDELNNVLLPRIESGEQRAAEKRLEAMRQDLGVSKQWIGGWELGAGSFGSAAVWVKQDSQGRIIDRIAVKDTILAADFLWDHNSDQWALDPSEPKDKRYRQDEQASKAPTEAVALLRLRSRVGAPECIVRIRNWRLHTETRMYRLLMEFCPYGDLADLALDSRYTRARRRLDKQEIVDQGLPPWIPEPFIWSVFESLATAGLLMEKGELDAHPGEPYWWEEIIHRDFKLPNIFLGENLESRYRGYPSTKLGDFGLSLILRKDDNRPNKRFAGVGTIGARPPEQAHTWYARPSAATNVWGIGIIIWSLISLEEADESLDWDDQDLLNRIGRRGPNFDAMWARQRVPEIDKNAEQFYSKELVGLMRECLQFDPNMRINIIRLRRRIIKHAQDATLTHGLRSAEKDNDGFRQDISFKASKWPPNGLARDIGDFPKGFGGMHKLPVPSSDGDSSDDNDLGGPRGAEIRVRGSQTAAQGTQERHEDQAVAGEEGGGEKAERRTAERRAEGEDVNKNDGTQANQQPEGTAPRRPPRINLPGPRAPGPPPPPTGIRPRLPGDRRPQAADPPPPPPDIRPRLPGGRGGSGAQDDAPAGAAAAAAAPPASTTALAIAALDALAAQQHPRNENENEDAAPPPPRPSRRPSRSAQQPPHEDENEDAAPPPPPPPPRPTRGGNRGRKAAAPTAPRKEKGRAAGITRAAGRAAPPPQQQPENEEEGEEEGEAAPREGRGKGKGRAGTRGAGKRKRDEAEAEVEEEEEEEEVVEQPRRGRGGRRRKK